MAYYSEKRLRQAVDKKLGKTVSDYEWGFIKNLLIISEPFHLEEEDLSEDLPRIKEVCRLLTIGEKVK